MLFLRKLVVFVILFLAAASILVEGSCRDWDISSCDDHQGCIACVLDLSWAKVDFCVEKSIADQLPEGEEIYSLLYG